MVKIVAQIFVMLIYCEWSQAQHIDINKDPKTIVEASEIAGAIIGILGPETALTRSLFATTTIEKFVEQFLIPVYLSETVENPLLIRKAYFKFLNDKHNVTASEIRREIESCGFTIESFVQTAEITYNEAEETIDTCYTAYRVAETHDNYLLEVHNVPNITPLKAKILSIMNKYLPIE